jgi:hypothetical protein
MDGRWRALVFFPAGQNLSVDDDLTTTTANVPHKRKAQDGADDGVRGRDVEAPRRRPPLPEKADGCGRGQGRGRRVRGSVRAVGLQQPQSECFESSLR